MSPLHEKALQYIGRGWKVFLVSKSKKPFKGSHGFLDATADPAELDRMFERHPNGQLGALHWLHRHLRRGRRRGHSGVPGAGEGA
jgi:hypothetical protein